MLLQEKEKYEKAWDHDAYRIYSPGEKWVFPFLMMATPKVGEIITDYGAGTGRASLLLHKLGYHVQMLDIAENCLDPEVHQAIGKKLQIGSLYGAPFWIRHSEYGFCVDVMEHIPPQFIYETLQNILRSSRKVFFHISFREDHFGAELGETLHLTVKPYSFWRDKLSEFATLTEARDLIHNGLFFADSKIYD